MNQQYPAFPPYGYPQTTAYPTYSPTPQQQFQTPQQHPQQHPQQQQQSPFFSSLPQGAPQQPHSHQQQPHQQQHQQHPRQSSAGLQNGVNGINPTSSPVHVPNGPGAPPPERDSPEVDYEQNLLNALRRDNAGENVDANQDQDNDDEEDDEMGEGNEDDPVYQLPPPPEAIYSNEVELEKAMHAWSLEHGYELVRRASKKNARGQLYKRYFHCSKHGKVASQKASEKTKVRVNRKSNRIGCPMSLAAVSVDPHDPSGNWQIRHRKTHHNHPAVDAIKLAGHRRRARVGGVEKAVDGLFAINTSTGDVLKFLQRTNPDGLFNRTDVANMKLKFNKYGTCAQKGGEPAPVEKTTPSVKTGFPSACDSCRSKKTKCDSVRPVCGACVRSQTACHYNHQPHPRAQQPSRGSNAQAGAGASNGMLNTINGNNQAGPSNGIQNGLQQTPVPAGLQQSMQNQDDSSMMGLDNSTMDTSGFQGLPNNSLDFSQQNNARQAEQVLAALANFQQEHVKPTKLSLESSSVEVLANSTCGNGDSYKAVVPRPFALGSDWKVFKENFMAAAVKENAYDVLIGDKKEPMKPVAEDGEQVPVEEHNEYIKQLAIFKRRNQMLKIGIKESLHPTLWSRVSGLSTALEIWTALDDMCMPRGSDQAYMRFQDLVMITHQQCGTLENYIYTLELKFNEFNQMAHNHETRRAASALNQSNLERLKRAQGGDGTFPEWILCFVFLKNLGLQHQGLAKNICLKNNIGGYGSGERITFKELAALVKRAIEWERERSGVSVQRS